ncbi:MAG: DUF362 domain-containing protein [Desulfovibrionaceae bacterium]|nr:DUF362 domain-containing protein [Desulfovibrionaceae bacterium]MBF0512557.1 DUF362 domain-containing protein [Desulfovibrionaceae bacterium]
MNKPSDTGHRAEGALTRRDFIKRAAAASALTLSAGALYAGLYDGRGPQPGDLGKVLTGLGDFSVQTASGQGRMAIVRGADRAAMLERAVTALGGIEAFIQKGDRVLIKVNAAFATPPSLGATTNPELFAAMARLCLAAGAASVTVTDNPINNPESCFALTGIAEAASLAGAGLIIPGEGMFSPLTLPGGKLLVDWPVMAGAFKGVTKLIAMAPVKDHARAGASMILKNFYGLLGGRRNVFHQKIAGIITELSLLAKPTLCVLDGTRVMLTNGPTGGSLSDLKAADTLIVSTDPVAADAAGLELLERTISEVPYIRMAEAAGAGHADYTRLNPVRINLGA